MDSFTRNVFDCLIENNEDISIEQVEDIIHGLDDKDMRTLEEAIMLEDEDIIAEIMLG